MPRLRFGFVLILILIILIVVLEDIIRFPVRDPVGRHLTVRSPQTGQRAMGKTRFVGHGVRRGGDATEQDHNCKYLAEVASSGRDKPTSFFLLSNILALRLDVSMMIAFAECASSCKHFM